MADEQPLTRRVEVLEEKMANLESFQENFDKTLEKQFLGQASNFAVCGSV